MKKILYSIVLVGLVSACNNDSKKTTEAQAAITEQQSNSSGLLTNPAHGQPGHDCALPVGAPLNQKSSNPQTTTTPTMTAPSAPQPVATQPSNGQKLNPAHGQPGHDCAKPVGAPLS